MFVSSVCMFVSLSVSLYVCQPVCQPVCQFVCVTVCNMFMSVFLSTEHSTEVCSVFNRVVKLSLFEGAPPFGPLLCSCPQTFPFALSVLHFAPSFAKFQNGPNKDYLG